MKLDIFVSYCHEDISPDPQRLNVVVDALGQAGGGLYDILLDSRHPGAAIGASLPAYYQQIDTADAVIILLTPHYKDRILKKQETGVYLEFRRIYDRLLDAQHKQTYNRSFLVLPIVFSGIFAESCPEELRHLVATDLTWLHVVPRAKKPTVRRELRAKLDETVRQLVDRIAAVAATKKRVYLARQENLFRDFLFHDTKSRWNLPENYGYLDSAFVKTYTFLRVRNREASFVVGRKGEGKSTIAHVLPVLSAPPPDVILAIDFELFPFEMCFNILRAHPAQASDLRHVSSPLFTYQLLWDAFFHLHYAWVARDALPKTSYPRRLVRKLLAEPLKNVTDPAETNGIATKVLFVHTFERLVSYLDKIVQTNARQEGVALIVGQLSPTKFCEYVFTEPGWKAIDSQLRAAVSAGNRLLVTADGFDTMVGYFTTEGPYAADALLFERELLLALFQVVLHKGSAKVGNRALYTLCDFCVTVPYDRFIDVRELDRDRYQFRRSFARIAWSGIELSALVRKRLALLRKASDPRGPSLEERLARLMRKTYPELPEEVSFVFKNAPYRMPLFIYVLRHTFWRPRDMLFYYASLLAACQAFRKTRSITMGTEFVRQIIAGATRSIIKDEFFAEFKAAFRNLTAVVNCFRLGPQVLDWGELGSRIDDIPFDTTLARTAPSSRAEKVEVLYDTGFLGVILERETAERLTSHQHAFVFNEEQLLGEKLNRDDYPQLKYAIHPVFCEYLNLDTTGNAGLILTMDWDYLHRNEVLRGIVAA